ncbi:MULTISPECIES: hypothetical protein [unclassified Burkholderia]|uniref:hypothetical protein n=1 Tax=unclassified Burkholderia TaxID=2613784 RepID=UPI000F58E7ED|nr:MULTISPECIES: hypothetical protein [unclassified Burkholderia]
MAGLGLFIFTTSVTSARAAYSVLGKTLIRMNRSGMRRTTGSARAGHPERVMPTSGIVAGRVDRGAPSHRDPFASFTPQEHS